MSEEAKVRGKIEIRYLENKSVPEVLFFGDVTTKDVQYCRIAINNGFRQMVHERMAESRQHRKNLERERTVKLEQSLEKPKQDEEPDKESETKPLEANIGVQDEPRTTETVKRESRFVKASS